MLGTLLTWWATQMPGWLPGRDPAARDTLLAEPLPASRIRLLRRRAGQETAIGTFGPEPGGTNALRAAIRAAPRLPLVLRLPPGVVLHRDVTLPAAAARNLAAVLGFEMDRLTPFRADAVHWTWTVLRSDRDGVAVRLHLLPRARVADALSTLSAAGSTPVLAESADPGMTMHLPLHGQAGAPAPRARAVRVLAAACAVLALAAAALPFVVQTARADRTEARIAALRPAVDEADALRRRLSTGGTDIEAVAAEQARLGSPMQVLAALTDALPDDTVLSELTLRGGQLAVSGQSGAAVRLVGALSADSRFRNPAFAAPVTRAEARSGDNAAAGRRDLFSLQADTGAPPPAPAGPTR